MTRRTPAKTLKGTSVEALDMTESTGVAPGTGAGRGTLTPVWPACIDANGRGTTDRCCTAKPGTVSSMALFRNVLSLCTLVRNALTAVKLDGWVLSFELPTVSDSDMDVLVERLVATLVSITSVKRDGDMPRICAKTRVRSAICCGVKVVLPVDVTEIEILSVTSDGHFAASFVVSITSAKSDNFQVTEERLDQVKMIGDAGYPM